jgi:hypothetical protein
MVVSLMMSDGLAVQRQRQGQSAESCSCQCAGCEHSLISVSRLGPPHESVAKQGRKDVGVSLPPVLAMRACLPLLTETAASHVALLVGDELAGRTIVGRLARAL